MIRLEYYTYSRTGIVSKNKHILSAILKARYQAIFLGVTSYVDIWNGEYLRTCRRYTGWLPFKFLYNNKRRRFDNSFNRLHKAIIKKHKAKAERIWIENNPHIHLLNYPYYKIKRWLKNNEN